MRWSLAVVFAVACGGDDEPRGDGKGDPTEPPDSPIDSATTTEPDPVETAGTGDTGDTGVIDEPIAILGFTIDCPGPTVTLSVETNVPAYDGIVISQETGSTYGAPNFIQAQDEHDLVSDGVVASVTLPTGVYPPDRDSSVFTCAGHYLDPEWMSFAFAVYGPDGAIVDCLAGGHDGEGFVAGDYAAFAVGAGIDPDFRQFLDRCRVGVDAR